MRSILNVRKFSKQVALVEFYGCTHVMLLLQILPY
jgi:hypothetical protein